MDQAQTGRAQQGAGTPRSTDPRHDVVYRTADGRVVRRAVTDAERATIRSAHNPAALRHIGAGAPRKATRRPLSERIDYASMALFCAAGSLGLLALGAAAQLLGIIE